MKALKDPVLEKYGWNYLSHMTDEFRKLIENAYEKIEPFSKEEISRIVTYFRVKGEELSDYDCCNNKKCIQSSKKAIRKEYGKGTHIEECSYINDSDHEEIERCSQCGRPLNEWLTWCSSELEYIEDGKPWTAEFLKDEAFTIKCILQSCPTMDHKISTWAIINRLEEALKEREAFFQRIGELAQCIINTDLN